MNPTREQEMLAEWLREWSLDQALREEEVAETVLPVEPITGEPQPAAGQIRLWPARDAEDEPFYGLLIPAGYGSWDLLPFSPFATPATPEEWRFRNTMPLRVAQAWNRRRIPRAVAETSWCAETLSDLEFQRVLRVLTRLDSGEAGDADCGPPLRHPLDPRRDYLEEETGRVTRALGEAWPRSVEGADVLLAAEPPPEER